MEHMDDDMPSTEYEPLFIREEKMDPDRTILEPRDGSENPSGLGFKGVQQNQSVLMTPYLQEMDDLLRNCEKLTGIPLVSHHSASFTETCLSESNCSQSKDKFTLESYKEMQRAPQTYLSTSYFDTHIDETAEGQSLGNLMDSCEVYQHKEMPLSSAGNKLSTSMVEYEGQLLGMLAMLESCMEEAGVDSEPQDQAADVGQEYVHISQNPYHCKDETLFPNESESPPELESQLNQPKLCVNGGKALEDSRTRLTVGSVGNGIHENLLHGCEMMSSLSERRPDKRGNLTTDQDIHELWLSGLQADHTKQNPIFSEGIKAKSMIKESKEVRGDVTERDVDNAEYLKEDRHEFKTELRSDVNKLRALGPQMEDCIEKVQHLQKRRKELLVEVLQLRGHKEREEAEGRSEEEEETKEWIDSKVMELMNVFKREEEERQEERRREICSLREERAEEEKKIWKVILERQGMQEELRMLKRRLFAVARDCAHNQAALNSRHREVELLKREEDKLNSLVLQLTEERCQLRSAQQQQLLDQQAKLHAKSSSHTSNTQEELSECRRHSCGDIQQYLQGGLKALEDRYEPILLALLKRRETTAGALVKTKEQAQELRAQLRPLREEIQKLKLQRACLEEKLHLSTIQRLEDVGHYKGAVYCLEEQSRELKTELEIQRRKVKEMEELRDDLTKQLLLHRVATDCDQEKKT